MPGTPDLKNADLLFLAQLFSGRNNINSLGYMKYHKFISYLRE